MIRQDRELLAELARLNSEVAPLAMRVMDGTITTTEQDEFADRLVRLGHWFHQRAAGSIVIEGDVPISEAIAGSASPVRSRR